MDKTLYVRTLNTNMANKLVQNLTLQKLRHFANSFNEAKSIFWDEEQNKIFHTGEYGAYRENIVKELFDLILPKRFGLGNGFIVNNVGDISTQCDIVIFDKTITPNIESDKNQKFYTVESVVGIGEIKSSISGPAELSGYLNKLAKIKAIREKTDEPLVHYRDFSGDYNPKDCPFDQLYSFLICSDLNYKDKDPSKLEYNKDIEYRHRHNFVLSIKDGAYLYKSPGKQNVYFPNNKGTNHVDTFIASNNAEFPIHLKQFLSSIISGLNMTTVLRPDMALYIHDKVTRKIT